MKPGDHPEFFTLPPPEGRSRESTIRLDREGRFFHDGRLVAHAGMAEAFASWIARHPLDGRYILNNGYDWTYLEVEDAPLVVQSFRVAGEDVELTLSDGRREPLDFATFRLGESGALYCSARGGRLRARFGRAAQLALGPYLREDAAGQLVLDVAGHRHVLQLETGTEG